MRVALLGSVTCELVFTSGRGACVLSNPGRDLTAAPSPQQPVLRSRSGFGKQRCRNLKHFFFIPFCIISYMFYIVYIIHRWNVLLQEHARYITPLVISINDRWTSYILSLMNLSIGPFNSSNRDSILEVRWFHSNTFTIYPHKNIWKHVIVIATRLY